MNTLTPTISNPTTDISPVDALWVLIQGQTRIVRNTLANLVIIN